MKKKVSKLERFQEAIAARFADDGPENDEFGLPRYFSLLSDFDDDGARLTKVKEFVHRAAQAAIFQVGREEAQRLFHEALKGKSPGQGEKIERNRKLLQTYLSLIGQNVPQKEAKAKAVDANLDRNTTRDAVRRRLDRQIQQHEAEHRWIEQLPKTLLSSDT